MSVIRFILTKWYVNGNVLIILKMFISFILTKWYVNSFVLLVVAGLVAGFILTKWYVNTDKCKELPTNPIVLY